VIKWNLDFSSKKRICSNTTPPSRDINAPRGEGVKQPTGVGTAVPLGGTRGCVNT
jgi:hypothetical protein